MGVEGGPRLRGGRGVATATNGAACCGETRCTFASGRGAGARQKDARRAELARILARVVVPRIVQSLLGKPPRKDNTYPAPPWFLRGSPLRRGYKWSVTAESGHERLHDMCLELGTWHDGSIREGRLARFLLVRRGESGGSVQLSVA